MAGPDTRFQSLPHQNDYITGGAIERVSQEKASGATTSRAPRLIASGGESPLVITLPSSLEEIEAGLYDR